MHEMSIANSVIQTIRAEARRRAGVRVRRVGLKIGELAGVDPDALRFCFEILAQDTELSGMELEIEFSRRRHRCPTCGRTFIIENYQLQCPQCGEPKTEYLSGDELELAYVEVEDAATAVATQSP